VTAQNSDNDPNIEDITAEEQEEIAEQVSDDPIDILEAAVDAAQQEAADAKTYGKPAQTPGA